MNTEQILDFLKSVPELDPDIDAVSDEVLYQICASTSTARPVSFHAPDGTVQINTDTSIQILQLVASYISIAVAIWAVLRQHPKGGTSVQPSERALDQAVLAKNPTLEQINENIRMNASRQVVERLGVHEDAT